MSFESRDQREVSLLEELVDLMSRFNPDSLRGHSLVLKFRVCYPRCRSCPHGPYWFRSVYSKRLGQWTFRYLGTRIRRYHLYRHELHLWPEIRRVDGKVHRLREALKAVRKKKRGKQ